VSFLIDTDWLLDAYADRGAALDLLEALSDRGLAVSALTLGEVYVGLLGRSNAATNLAFFRRFVRKYAVIDASDAIMLTYADLKLHLDRQGRPLEYVDLVIAATAITTERTLITRNRGHFERVPGLRIY
jgi:predicted nucleic acid-binding protein